MARLALSRFAATQHEWAAHCRAAERLGIAAVSSGDTQGRDAFVDAGVALAATESIPVRIAVAIPSRSPLQTANAAAGLADLGRGLTLGIGAGNPHTNTVAHGIPYGPPLARLRAFHTCVSAILRAPAGEPVAVETEFFRAATTGFGLDSAAVPIVFGAHHPGALRLAGEVAEGALVHLLTPLEEIGPRLEAATAGRTRPFLTGAGVITSVDPDEEEALRRARAEAAASFALPPFAPRLAAHAGKDAAAAFGERVAAGDLAGAAATLPEPTVRSFVLVTTPERFADDIAAIPTETVQPLPVGVFAPMFGAGLGFTADDAAAGRARLAAAIFGDAPLV